MLGLALESWTNKGIWVLGRSKTQYPQRLKKQLRHLAIILEELEQPRDAKTLAACLDVQLYSA